jgi:hypothetical protein
MLWGVRSHGLELTLEMRSVRHAGRRRSPAAFRQTPRLLRNQILIIHRFEIPQPSSFTKARRRSLDRVGRPPGASDNAHGPRLRTFCESHPGDVTAHGAKAGAIRIANRTIVLARCARASRSAAVRALCTAHCRRGVDKTRCKSVLDPVQKMKGRK